MSNYEVIDNVLHPFALEKLKVELQNNQIPWYLTNRVNVEQKGETLQKCYYFAHMMFLDYQVKSDLFSLVEDVLKILRVKALIRVKANLYPNIGERIKNSMHIDNNFDNAKAAILYLNTCDAPTTLEDGTEIEAIENRLLIFEGHKPHCSSHPTNVKQRFNINFNYF
jgi:hypothetical protein